MQHLFRIGTPAAAECSIRAEVLVGQRDFHALVVIREQLTSGTVGLADLRGAWVTLPKENGSKLAEGSSGVDVKVEESAQFGWRDLLRGGRTHGFIA